MTSKFEQLIEYVINDEEQKARELFHDIVVEKSREIYENLMNEEEEELDEGEDLEEGKEEESEEDLEESACGGDASDELIRDVEMEEEGMEMSEGEEEGEEVEFDAEEEGGEDLEDRVVDLEDKLDELMAEFEALMGDEGDSDFGVDGGDELEMDDTEEFNSDGEEEEVEEFGMMENVDLKAAPKPVTSEEGGINTKSTVAANAGAKGPIGNSVKPVSVTGGEAKGRPAPTAKDLGGTTSPKQGPATKPVTTQASGVNTKSPVAKA